MALFNVLKEDVEAKKPCLDFLYKIEERGIQMQENNDLSNDDLTEGRMPQLEMDQLQMVFQTSTRCPH